MIRIFVETIMNKLKKIYPIKDWPVLPTPALQWVTMGPLSGVLSICILRMNCKNGAECSGTPWSGQAVNWNCFTSLRSVYPIWNWCLSLRKKIMNTKYTRYRTSLFYLPFKVKSNKTIWRIKPRQFKKNEWDWMGWSDCGPFIVKHHLRLIYMS